MLDEDDDPFELPTAHPAMALQVTAKAVDKHIAPYEVSAVDKVLFSDKIHNASNQLRRRYSWLCWESTHFHLTHPVGCHSIGNLESEYCLDIKILLGEHVPQWTGRQSSGMESSGVDLKNNSETLNLLPLNSAGHYCFIHSSS